MSNSAEKWAPLMILALIGAMIGLFFLLFRYEKVTFEKGPSPAARSNPFLAAKVFLESREVPTETLRRWNRNRDLPPQDTVLFMLGDRQNLSPTYSKRLLEWVQQGGLLVFKPDQSLYQEATDTLLEEPGFFLYDEDEDTVKRGVIEVNWESGVSTKLTFNDPLLFGVPEEQPIGLHVGTDGVYRLAVIGYGKGALCVVADDSFLRNGTITEHDNAWLAWQVVIANGRPPSKAVIVYGGSSGGLWSKVGTRGWPLLVTGILLIIVFCWGRGYRERALQPDPPPIRRRLLEHIEHTGLFLWKHRRSVVLAQAVVNELKNTMRRRHQVYQDADAAQVHHFMAEQSGLTVAEVEAAVDGPDTHTEREFLNRIIDLETIRRAL